MRQVNAVVVALSAFPLLLLALSSGAVAAGVGGKASQTAAADVTIVLTNMGKMTFVTGAGCNGCAAPALPVLSRNGYVEFNAADVATEWVGGLSHARPRHGPVDIDFGFHLTGGGFIEVRENGVPLARTEEARGDVFRIAVHHNRVEYMKNEAVFYTSTRTPVYPLRVAVAPRAQGIEHGEAAGSGSLAPTPVGDRIAALSPVPSSGPSAVASAGQGSLPGSSIARLASQEATDPVSTTNQGGGLGLGSSTSAASAPVQGSSSAAPSPSSQGSTGPVTATVSFIGVSGDGRLTPANTFSGQILRDLLIDVTWNLAGGTHVQRLELFSPDGALYQRFSSPLDDPGPMTTLETQVLVGGTWITQHSLFGAWRVAAYLDNGPVPAASTGFVLTQ